MQGNINITTDIKTVDEITFNNENVVAILFSNDLTSENNFRADGNVIEASILIPPYEVLEFLLNNQHDKFESAYADYLFTNKDAYLFIQLILKSMFYGRNAVLVLTNDELAMGYAHTFCSIIKNTLGIIIGMNDIPFSAPPIASDYVCGVLYLNAIFTVEEFFRFLSTPLPSNVDQRIINKIYNDIRPMPGTDVLKFTNKLLLNRKEGFTPQIPYKYSHKGDED